MNLPPCRPGPVLAAALTPLMIAGCAASGSAAESSAINSESAPAEITTGPTDCAATAVFGDENSLFGREWLLTHKANAPASGVSLLRCHYVHDQNDVDNLYSGGFVPPASVTTDGAEVHHLIASLPDSTDPSLWRCPGGQAVASFEVTTVIDASGTPTAKFQTSEGGNGCGMFRVMPSV